MLPALASEAFTSGARTKKPTNSSHDFSRMYMDAALSHRARRPNVRSLTTLRLQRGSGGWGRERRHRRSMTSGFARAPWRDDLDRRDRRADPADQGRGRQAARLQEAALLHRRGRCRRCAVRLCRAPHQRSRELLPTRSWSAVDRPTPTAASRSSRVLRIALTIFFKAALCRHTVDVQGLMRIGAMHYWLTSRPLLRATGRVRSGVL